ncbi:MAG: hypothetical protein FWG84_04220 [Bacteroidales bacterium]|nr:hypothetical protein [Bacteroidales bacterium]
MNVIFLPEVQKYYGHLEQILYENGYFGFMESSKRYVKELVDDIKTNLPTKPHRPAPRYFDRYGQNMEYAVFKKSKRTQWYVFFRVYRENDEDFYQVRYIANNHTVAQYLG